MSVCGESGLDLGGTDVHEIPSSGGRGAQQGQNCTLDLETLGGQEEGAVGVMEGGPSGLKEDSGHLLRGTGRWLTASCAVDALAKEAEIQGNGPMRAGVRV